MRANTILYSTLRQSVGRLPASFTLHTLCLPLRLTCNEPEEAQGWGLYMSGAILQQLYALP